MKTYLGQLVFAIGMVLVCCVLAPLDDSGGW